MQFLSHPTFRKHTLLVQLSLFSICLLLLRFAITQELLYAFLVWNLFLAVLPLIFSNSLLKMSNREGGKLLWKMLPLLFLWMLFLPNAPYIITDLFHLRLKGGAPIWFDLILILSFGLLGALLGLKSLQQMNRLLHNHLSQKALFVFNGSVMFLCAFGIYIGRFQRWNSWDIITRPMTLLTDVKDLFSPNIFTAEITLMTLIYGIFLFICYQGFNRAFSSGNR